MLHIRKIEDKAMKKIKAFHIDSGRKYFFPEQLKDIIDVMAKNHYNLLEWYSRK